MTGAEGSLRATGVATVGEHVRTSPITPEYATHQSAASAAAVRAPDAARWSRGAARRRWRTRRRARRWRRRRRASSFLGGCEGQAARAGRMGGRSAGVQTGEGNCAKEKRSPPAGRPFIGPAREGDSVSTRGGGVCSRFGAITDEITSARRHQLSRASCLRRLVRCHRASSDSTEGALATVNLCGPRRSPSINAAAFIL